MRFPELAGDDLYEAFAWFAIKYACNRAVTHFVEQLYDGDFNYPLLAYVCAWLSVAGGTSVLFVNDENIAVGRLSKTAQAAWRERLDQIREIRVLALARRYKRDIDDTVFKDKCFGETWEVVVVVEMCSFAGGLKLSSTQEFTKWLICKEEP